MQPIHINFIVPQGWQELDDKQLRFVYELIAKEYATDEIKTICFLRWSGTKVIGKQPNGTYLLRKGRAMCKEERSTSISSLLTRPSSLLPFTSYLFEATPLTLAELLPHLAWLGSLPPAPIRLSKINRRQALPADFEGVPFETYIICDNLYQGYLATQDDALLDQLGAMLYGKAMRFQPCERISIFYWFAALKTALSKKYADFFQPLATNPDGNLLGSSAPSVEDAMNAQIRALTKGDITKETEVLALDTHRALTELNAQAREYKELNNKIQSK